MSVTLPAAQDLVAALHQGTLGTPPWGEFLELLKRRTGADHAHIITDDSAASLSAAMRPGRTYAADEIAVTDGFLNRYMEKRGLAFLRMVRVEEPSGSSLWIAIGRKSNDFAAADAALLRDLAVHLQTALRTWVALERERLRAGISGDAIRRLNFGWILLDRGARIIDLSDEAESILQGAGGLHRGPDGTLIPDRRDAQGALRQFLRQRDRGDLPSRAVHISDEPWLDMLLTVPKGNLVRRSQDRLTMAFVTGEQSGGAERSTQLRELFGLSEKEAQLALLISRGVSIKEAAAKLDLTLETARVYSKRIYAKTGTRGQADLVRVILASIVALS